MPRVRLSVVLALAFVALAAAPAPRAAAEFPRAAGPEAGATRAASKVLEVLDDVRASMRATRYQHNTVVRERRGEFFWDCSGMADWVLARAAPVAGGAISRARPVARDYFRAIERAPLAPNRPRRGWQRLPRITDAQPGDVFAWVRPPGFPSRNTGHIGFLLSAPEPAPGIRDAYVARIVDATSLPHEDDTRTYESSGGFGEGTILFLTDGAGHATAYGWFGMESRGVVVTPILFGRVHR
jgi:hypothetical protein